MKLHIQSSLLFLSLLASLNSCVRLDFDKDEIIPDPEGAISLTTDWSKRGAGIQIPSEYYVLIDALQLSYQQETNILPTLAPATYPTQVYNKADKITIANNIATVATTEGVVEPNPGYLFSSFLDIVVDNKSKTYTAHMVQQVRELNILVRIVGDGKTASTLTATLSGVANTLNLKTGAPDGVSTSIKPVFTKSENDFKSTVHLLGVHANPQILSLNIVFSDGSQKLLTSDVSSKLSAFNTDKHIPITLEANYDMSTGQLDFKISIADWQVE